MDLQQGLCEIYDWSLSQKLTFNVAKYNLLHFNTSACEFNYNYSMDGMFLPTLDSHKDLGVIISIDLSCVRHYNAVVAKAYNNLA